MSVIIMLFLNRGDRDTQMYDIDAAGFDLTVAREMVGEGDRIIAGLSMKETVVRREYEQYRHIFHELYGMSLSANVFFDRFQFENRNIDVLDVNRDIFFPTVFHEGIELVSAEIRTYTFESDFTWLESKMDSIYLVIRVEYTGDDEKLAGWFREHIYVPRRADFTVSEDGEETVLSELDREREVRRWIFDGFNGKVYFFEDGFDADYLPLR
jgi:hypothetical protein